MPTIALSGVRIPCVIEATKVVFAALACSAVSRAAIARLFASSAEARRVSDSRSATVARSFSTTSWPGALVDEHLELPARALEAGGGAHVRRGGERKQNERGKPHR